jgi:hypothetical protein
METAYYFTKHGRISKRILSGDSRNFFTRAYDRSLLRNSIVYFGLRQGFRNYFFWRLDDIRGLFS